MAISNVTKQEYQCVNLDSSHASCHSSNFIYLLTCTICNQQYVGESRQELHARLNGHRSSKIGCSHVIHHRDTCEGSTFTMQILENLEGTGYDDIHKKIHNQDITIYRRAREDIWMKKLRTIYPYGLNEKAFDKTSCDSSNLDTGIGRLFPPLQRSRTRPVRSRIRSQNLNPIHSVESFFLHLDSAFSNNKTDLYNNIRVLVNTLPRGLLRRIASEIMHPETFAVDSSKEQIYLFILDLIDTKFYKEFEEPKKDKSVPKNVCVIHFVNKGIDLLHLPSIFKCEQVVELLPKSLSSENDIPITTFSLNSPIRNKILNYKEVVTNLHIVRSGGKFHVNNLPECECHLSDFCETAHGHIVTGDLRIVQNNKLRKLISKGPKFREPRFLNLNKCLNAVCSGLDEFIQKTTSKCKSVKKDSLKAWKDKILFFVENRIKYLKNKIKPSPTKPIFKDPNVVTCLENLHNKFVLVPIDKASNNIAIICKRFYIEKLLKEVGILYTPSNTYSLVHTPLKDIADLNITLCKSYNPPVSERDEKLPCMYWTPKMHYTPSRSRFIVASASCSTKPISKVVSVIFSKIFNQIESFHLKSRFYKQFNMFWVIQNSKPILDRLNKLNRNNKDKSISTYDFSTLYTKLLHDDLITVLNQLIDFVFKGGRKKADGSKQFMTVKGNLCYFSKKKSTDTTYSIRQIKMMVDHLISQSFFSVCNLVFRPFLGKSLSVQF